MQLSPVSSLGNACLWHSGNAGNGSMWQQRATLHTVSYIYIGARMVIVDKIPVIAAAVCARTRHPNRTGIAQEVHGRAPHALPLLPERLGDGQRRLTAKNWPHVRNDDANWSELWPRLAAMFDPPRQATPHTNETTRQILTSHERVRTRTSDDFKKIFPFCAYVWDWCGTTRQTTAPITRLSIQIGAGCSQSARQPRDKRFPPVIPLVIAWTQLLSNISNRYYERNYFFYCDKFVAERDFFK